MPCKEEEDEVNGSTFGGMPKVMFFWIRQKNKRTYFGGDERCIRCRFPSSRRFPVGVRLGFHGLKSPRLFIFPSSRSFLFSIIIYRWVRLKDAMPERANSRGFLNPWYSSVSHTSAVCKDANRQRFVVQGRDTACEKRKNVLLYNKKQERGRRLPSPYCSYA